MKHIIFFLLSLAGVLCAAERKPNVIFILTDDQGWNDAHFAGHPYVKTPNLDRFASQSTWFRQFYVAATVCSPSRCAFMTSHFPARHLIHGHISTDAENAARSMPDWLDPEVTTLPDLMKTAGYATAHFGKWHLGGNSHSPPPSEYGIDVARVVNGNGPALGTDGSKLANESKDRPEVTDPYFRAHSTALIVDETIKFMREHRDQPFYINLWTLLPHAPLQPTPEQLKEYESLAPSASDPAFGPWMQKYLANAKDLTSQMRVFCASLTNLDAELGRLFAALEEMKLAENTIVFYSSDNGAEDYRIGNAANAGVGNTGPLRARKRSMYEGGIRTFGLVRWPGHVAAGRRDETSVLSGVDFLPTICHFAGVQVPAAVQPDGEDMSDVWLGKTRPRSRPLFWEWLFRVQGEDYTPPMLSVRDGDWKLFVNHDGTHPQLYEVTKDLGEEHDLAPQQPERVKALTAETLAWVKTLPPSKARDEVAATGQPQDRSGKAKPAAAKAGAAPAKPSGPGAPDRSAMFDKKDADHDGKMTLEEYLRGFPDQEEGKARYARLDTDHDGVLSREEFMKAGR